MLKKLKNFIKELYLKKGFKTDRKIIVIESDDWGSIRSTKQGLDYAQKSKNISLNPFQKYDCLENSFDISNLSSTLRKYKDKNGKHPIVTTNFIMQNPCIDKDSEICFKNFYELYENKDEMLSAIKAAEKEHLIDIELHGLIHFNLQKIKQDKSNFQRDCLKLGTIGMGGGQYDGMDTFNVDKTQYGDSVDIKKANDIFKETFGRPANSFIFPCYVFLKQDILSLNRENIYNLQSGLFQNIPVSGKNREYKKRLHYMGQKTDKTMLTTRNCFFEPVSYLAQGRPIQECIDRCMAEIKKAFDNKKPAIICCHRMNFASSLSKDIAKKSISAFDELLSEITKTFKDVEFLSSTELFNLIRNNK